MSVHKAELSDDEQIKQQEELIKLLDNADTVGDFVKECKNIGQTAVAIDNDFIAIKNSFDDFIKTYGNSLPKVKSDFVPQWAGFMARWSGSNGLLWSSRDLAAKTAATLSDYDINLELVEMIATQKDLKEAQAELQEYINENPVSIATEVADGFKNLKNDLGKFSDDLKQYLVDEGKKLTKEAQGYEEEIVKYQAEVESIYQDIKKLLALIGVTSIFSIVSTLGNMALLIVDFAKLAKAQGNLNAARSNLYRVTMEQNALASMQASFEHIKPEIDDICIKLGIFASIWAFMTEQSVEIKTTLDEGVKVVSTRKFTIKLDLLRKQVAPLKEGMREYATQIV